MVALRTVSWKVRVAGPQVVEAAIVRIKKPQNWRQWCYTGEMDEFRPYRRLEDALNHLAAALGKLSNQRGSEETLINASERLPLSPNQRGAWREGFRGFA